MRDGCSDGYQMRRQRQRQRQRSDRGGWQRRTPNQSEPAASALVSPKPKPKPCSLFEHGYRRAREAQQHGIKTMGRFFRWSCAVAAVTPTIRAIAFRSGHFGPGLVRV